MLPLVLARSSVERVPISLVNFRFDCDERHTHSNESVQRMLWLLVGHGFGGFVRGRGGSYKTQEFVCQRCHNLLAGATCLDRCGGRLDSMTSMFARSGCSAEAADISKRGSSKRLTDLLLQAVRLKTTFSSSLTACC